jgi:hypothetical protein
MACNVFFLHFLLLLYVITENTHKIFLQTSGLSYLFYSLFIMSIGVCNVGFEDGSLKI